MYLDRGLPRAIRPNETDGTRHFLLTDNRIIDWKQHKRSGGKNEQFRT